MLSPLLPIKGPPLPPADKVEGRVGDEHYSVEAGGRDSDQEWYWVISQQKGESQTTKVVLPSDLPVNLFIKT